MSAPDTTAKSAYQKSADITFLALTLYREARGESSVARLAVAYSIMERVSKPGWWGNDVQSVLFKRWQYGSLTAPKDPQLGVWPAESSDPIWQDCLSQAVSAYTHLAPNPAPDADSYFDDGISPPSWAKPEMLVIKIGRLSFYNLDRDHEPPAT